MADTTAATGLTVQQWDSQFNREYFQDRFKELKGLGEGNIVQMKRQLNTMPGDSVTFALVNRLTNTATTGTAVLEGNEEDLISRSFRVYVDKRRNAVRVPEMAEQKSAISLRQAARPTLLDWAQEDTRDLYINALTSINGTAFVDRTAVIGDAWLVDNLDRIVFGAGVGSGTDLSADLAQLDATNDLFTNVNLDRMILKAKTCNPKIRPMKDEGNGKRYYVAFANPNAFADLRASIDTEVLALTTVEMQASKLFMGGDLYWNGCIIKEADNMPIWADLGTGGTVEVTPVHLLGSQAIGHATCKDWKTITEEFDYGDKHGVAVETIMGVQKIRFGTSASTDTGNTKDYGVVTGFFATTGSPTVSAAIAAEN
jgi:N4-gp56 family major capsid protein